MNSNVAKKLDDNYDRLQWSGEEYILEELTDEVKVINKSEEVYSREVMYWMGYTYILALLYKRVK